MLEVLLDGVGVAPLGLPVLVAEVGADLAKLGLRTRSAAESLADVLPAR